MPVASWFDDMSDTELRDLIPFFDKLSKMDSVYTVLMNTNHPTNSTISQNQIFQSSSQVQWINSSHNPITSVSPFHNEIQNGTTSS